MGGFPWQFRSADWYHAGQMAVEMSRTLCSMESVMRLPSRRRFLQDVGRGMLVASVGPALAFDLRLASAADVEGSDRIRFGSRDRLVDLLQSSTPEQMLRLAVAELKRGATLKDL